MVIKSGLDIHTYLNFPYFEFGLDTILQDYLVCDAVKSLAIL
jgi:hypothetical protein